MGKYFYCYSLKLKDYLKLKGLRYDYKRIHNNGKYYFMFEFNEGLTDALDEWDEFKEKYLNKKGEMNNG